MCLSSVEIELLQLHWFLFYRLTSVIPVDKISIASSNSLCDLGLKNECAVKWFGLSVFFPSVMMMELEQGNSMLQIPGRKKAFYSWHWGPCANITSITTENRATDHWSLETY